MRRWNVEVAAGRQRSAQADTNSADAAKPCKAEQADPTFAGGHEGKSFSDFYGPSGNGNGERHGQGNAFGKFQS